MCIKRFSGMISLLTNIEGLQFRDDPLRNLFCTRVRWKRAKNTEVLVLVALYSLNLYYSLHYISDKIKDTIQRECSKLELCGILSLSSEKHAKYPFVNFVQVQAYKLRATVDDSGIEWTPFKIACTQIEGIIRTRLFLEQVEVNYHVERQNKS